MAWMLLLPIIAPAIGCYVGWQMFEAGWQKVKRCRKCGRAGRDVGYLPISANTCPGCGETHRNYEDVVRRPTLIPFVYEYKEDRK